MAVCSGLAGGFSSQDVPCFWQNEKGGARESAEQAIQHMGGVDALVCVIPDATPKKLTLLSEAELDDAYATMYRSTLMYMKAAAADMVSRKAGGSIVLLTSHRALRAKKEDFLSGSLHAGLHRSMQSFALQMAPHQIRINAVAAGEMGEAYEKIAFRLPLQRAGQWEEAARTVLFLLSGASSYITGAVIPCDGGYGLSGIPEKDEGYGWDPEQSFDLSEGGV